MDKRVSLRRLGKINIVCQRCMALAFSWSKISLLVTINKNVK